MKITKIFFFLFANTLLTSSAPATDIPNFDKDLERIAYTYPKTNSLDPEKYTEDLKTYYATAKEIISEELVNLSGKKLGIVIGENHQSEGTKCLEVLLLKIAQSANIHHCLVEFSDEELKQIEKKGNELGEEIGFIYKIIREAQETKMAILPIDDHEIKSQPKQELEPLEDFKKGYLEGKKREKHFIEKILTLKESFIFYTGANHLSTLYYDEKLNNEFSLIFFNCSKLLPKESTKTLNKIIKIINNPEVSEIHTQRQKFLTETKNVYNMPVRYNQNISDRYKWQSKLGFHPTYNEDELRQDTAE